MGEVIGILSAKGGVGKTLLAANLLVAFGLGHRLRTALIDLTPGTGNADLMLDLQPEHTWEELREVIPELKPRQLQLAVTPYQPGLDLLACPPEVTWDCPLRKSELAALLKAFVNLYDVVILDLPTGTSDLTHHSLDLVDLLLFVVTPDAPSLRAASRYLQGLPPSRTPTSLVINQQGQSAAVTPSEIENHLGIKLAGVLPIDPQGVWVNVSYGEPCSMRKSSELGRAIRKLTAQLIRMLNSQT